jgi:hypothetical protein
MMVKVDPRSGWFHPTLIPILRRAGKPCFFYEGELIQAPHSPKELAHSGVWAGWGPYPWPAVQPNLLFYLPVSNHKQPRLPFYREPYIWG